VSEIPDPVSVTDNAVDVHVGEDTRTDTKRDDDDTGFGAGVIFKTQAMYMGRIELCRKGH
jgi:hypothetical protein